MLHIITLYIAGIIYAIVRYVAFAPQNLESLPVFVVNKGVSMVAALCFAAAFFQQFRRARGTQIRTDPGTWFRAGTFGAIVHIPISLAILRPGYFKEFFAEERLSFAGEMVFLFGGLTAALIYILHRPTWSPAARWRLSLLAMLTLFTHVVAMGYCRGLNINKSHAYMPPMWLLSAIGIAAGIGILLFTRPSSTTTTPPPTPSDDRHVR